MVSTVQWRVAAVAAVLGLLVVVLALAWTCQAPPPGSTTPAVQAERVTADAASGEAAPEPGVAAPDQREAVELPHPVSTEPESKAAVARVADPSLLAGHVRLDTGAAAAGARVRIGKAVTVADGDGAFVFSRKAIRAEDTLVATLAGHQPAVVAAVGETAAFRDGSELEVVLPGLAWGIDGWLVDAVGTPCQGWKIELYRGTACGTISWPNVLAEDLAAGAEVPSGAVPGAPVPEAGRPPQDRPSPTTNPNLQAIGADGTFRIGGLCKDRDYVLRAWNNQTLQIVISPPIAAGTSNYLFTVPDAACRERVWGRTVDRYGLPIADVRVRLTMVEHQVDGWSSYQTGQTVATGADGGYEFRQVPRQDLLLRFDSPEVEGLSHELKASDSGADLEIQLACTCRFHYEARPGAVAATALRILDADEYALRLRQQLGPGRSSSSSECAIEDGRTPELAVSDAAVWLELRADNRVLQRVPVRLERNQQNVLR